MNIIVNMSIDRSITNVWEVMGNQFGDAHIWSSYFKTSKPGGEAKFKGLDFSHRDTTTERGNTIQELTDFDIKNHSLTYKVTKGAPEIAAKAGATWSLKSEVENETILNMTFVMEPKMPLNNEMELKIKTFLTQSAIELAEELKFYLETGTPHPNNSK